MEQGLLSHSPWGKSLGNHRWQEYSSGGYEPHPKHGHTFMSCPKDALQAAYEAPPSLGNIKKKIVWKLIFSKAFQQSASCSSGKTNPVLSILSLFSLLLHLLLPQTCWEVPFPARILRKASKNPNKDKQILASLFLMGLMVPLRPVVIPLKAPGPAVRGNTTFIKKQPKEDISCCLSW